MSGHARGTVTKAQLIDKLKHVPHIKGESWLNKQSLHDLLGAVHRFNVAQGVTQAEVEKTLFAAQGRSREAAHGRVSTIKLCLGTVLGEDKELMEKLDVLVRCCSILHWRAYILMNCLFVREWGGAPAHDSLDDALFGEVALTAEQQEVIRSLCGDAKRESRGILQSLVLPECIHVPQHHQGSHASPSSPVSSPLPRPLVVLRAKARHGASTRTI